MSAAAQDEGGLERWCCPERAEEYGDRPGTPTLIELLLSHECSMYY